MIPNYNYSALEAILTQITNHPESLNMSLWDCGTTKCFAGWACSLFDKDYSPLRDWSETNRNQSMDYYINTASRILGILPEEADIFYVSNEELIQVLQVMVSQKDFPACHKKTITQIANAHDILIPIPQQNN